MQARKAEATFFRSRFPMRLSRHSRNQITKLKTEIKKPITKYKNEDCLGAVYPPFLQWKEPENSAFDICLVARYGFVLRTFPKRASNLTEDYELKRIALNFYQQIT